MFPRQTCQLGVKQSSPAKDLLPPTPARNVFVSCQKLWTKREMKRSLDWRVGIGCHRMKIEANWVLFTFQSNEFIKLPILNISQHFWGFNRTSQFLCFQSLSAFSQNFWSFWYLCEREIRLKFLPGTMEFRERKSMEEISSRYTFR